MEGLRGLCAALVLYAHLFAPAPALDPQWAPPAGFWWFNLGSAAVLMFFILSGYVIGLTVTGKATAESIRGYLARRALRLVPVVTIAVMMSWAFLPHTPARTVVGNLLFLQNSDPYPGGVTFDLMANNPNLWSLNYEAAYYLAFIAVWRWTPRAFVVWSLLLAVTFLSAAGWTSGALFSHLACGGLYWFAGLLLAWETSADHPERRTNWPAALLGAYALWTIAPLRHGLARAEWFSWFGGTPASPYRLDFLPACAWVLAACTGRAPRLRRWLTLACLAWTAVGFGLRGVAGSLVASDYVAGAGLLAACALARWEVRTDFLGRLAPLGAVSFGIYVFATPIQFAQRRILPDFSGSVLTYAARVGVVVGVTLGLAWLVERRLYPALRRRFIATRPVERAS